MNLEDELLEKLLTPALLERGFRATNGEWAWSRADVASVVRLASARGLAVLGGESWHPTGDRRWTFTEPGVMRWTSEQRPGEDWLAYCERSAEDAQQALAAFAKAELQAGSEPAFWNLTFLCEPPDTRP